MTLSCAEYFWPDMIHLLEERIWIAHGRNVDHAGIKVHRDGSPIDLCNDRKACIKAVNDYSIVVQEFLYRISLINNDTFLFDPIHKGEQVLLTKLVLKAKSKAGMLEGSGAGGLLLIDSPSYSSSDLRL